MAKTQKYDEDQLLDAVVKYAEIERKKIKATELAKWCRNNIEGLEEVRDYHFTRPIREKDEKTGKVIDRSKLCTLKIEEINKTRSLTASINTNLLLRASNIDTFMEQTDIVKRKMIVETRKTVDKLLVQNGNIVRENEALKSENKSMKIDILKLTEKIDKLQIVQDALSKRITYLMKATDEAARKEMLSQMGITDKKVDLDVYSESLQQKLSEVIDINKTLRRYLSDVEEKEEKTSDITSDIMSGLNL